MDLHHIGSLEAAVAHAEWHIFPASLDGHFCHFLFKASPYGGISYKKKAVQGHSPKEFSNQDIMATQFNALQLPHINPSCFRKKT